MELISREEAIKMVNKWFNLIELNADILVDSINSLPTIEERKEGHWIKHIDDLFPADSTIECSVCHEEQYTTIDDNYCPNCGAKMKGE